MNGEDLYNRNGDIVLKAKTWAALKQLARDLKINKVQGYLSNDKKSKQIVFTIKG